MKKTFILCVFFSAIIPTHAINLDVIKEEYHQSNEAIKKIFPAFSKTEDPLHRGIPGFNIEIKPEMAQFWTGFFSESALIAACSIGINLVSNNNTKKAAALSIALSIGLPAALWHPKSKAGPYFAAGATTSAIITTLCALFIHFSIPEL